MKRWGVFAGLAIFLIVFTGLGLGRPPTYPEIDEDMVGTHSKKLSSDAFEGRLTGSEGNDNAVSYIENQIGAILEASGRDDADISLRPFTVPVQSYEDVPVLTFRLTGIKEGESSIMDIPYGQDFATLNRPRSGNVDYTGDLLVITDTIYELDPELLKGKIVVTKLNRVTDDTIDDLIDRGAVGILNMFSRSFDPASQNIKYDTSVNLRVDWKAGRRIFIGSIGQDVYRQLVEEAKNNLIEEYSNLEPVIASGYIEEKVTGYVRDAHVKSVAKYPVLETHNVVAKFPGKKPGSGAVVLSTDVDGYGREVNGKVLNSPSQGMTSGLLLELMRTVAQAGNRPDKDVYFAFLNGSKQGDYGMKAFLSQMDTKQRLEWIHIQNAGGTGRLPLMLGDAASTGSDRQWAIQLRMQLHAQEAGVVADRGIPEEAVPGFYALIENDIPHIILTSGTDRYIASDPFDQIDMSTQYEIGTLMHSYIVRDVLHYTAPDYLTYRQIGLVVFLLVVAVLCMYFNKLSKEAPGLEFFGKNVRYLSNTRVFSGVSSTVYFLIPAGGLMLFMIFLLLFPKMFVASDYYGIYSGYSPYLYLKRTVEFTNGLLKSGLSLQGQGRVDIRILTNLVAGSFKLVIPAILISIVVGLLKGALDSYKPTDGKNFISLVLLSMPDVLVAFLGLQFIIWWSKNEGLAGFIGVDAMRGIVMPVIALSIIPSVYISRLALIAVEEERHKGYVRGVLAKGATKRQAYVFHLLPVMMLKILDAMPSVMKLFIANLIIVEYFYGYPGIANYLITHMGSVTLVLILSMGIGLMYLILNLTFKTLAVAVNPMKRRGI